MFPKLAKEEAFWVGSKMFFLCVPIHPSPEEEAREAHLEFDHSVAVSHLFLSAPRAETG